MKKLFVVICIFIAGCTKVYYPCNCQQQRDTLIIGRDTWIGYWPSSSADSLFFNGEASKVITGDSLRRLSITGSFSPMPYNGCTLLPSQNLNPVTIIFDTTLKNR